MDEKELERRELRRKRRRRNQLFAYLTLVLIIAAIGVGGYFGVLRIKRMLDDYDKKVAEAIVEAKTEVMEEVTEGDTDSDVMENVEESLEEPIEILPETDPLDELVDVLINDMPLEEKIAGLFLVSPEQITGVGTCTQAGNGTKTALENNPVGGLIYTKKNYLSESQFQEMLSNSISYSKYPLFLAVDKECGEDTSFGTTRTDIQGDITLEANVGIVFSMMTEELTNLHFNMILSPVADIVSEDGTDNLLGRAFGSSAEGIAPLVYMAVDTIQERMDSATKTFPGEGGVNSANELVKSVEELKNAEFITFNKAIEAKASAIIVSNLYAVGITGEKIPACLSEDVIQVLKEDLGYEGIVMTDYLNEKTVTDYISSKEVAVKAIQAGADMLLNPKSYKDAYTGLLEAVNNGNISEERINDALHRIYKIKYKNALE